MSFRSTGSGQTVLSLWASPVGFSLIFLSPAAFVFSEGWPGLCGSLLASVSGFALIVTSSRAAASRDAP